MRKNNIFVWCMMFFLMLSVSSFATFVPSMTGRTNNTGVMDSYSIWDILDFTSVNLAESIGFEDSEGASISSMTSCMLNGDSLDDCFYYGKQMREEDLENYNNLVEQEQSVFEKYDDEDYNVDNPEFAQKKYNHVKSYQYNKNLKLQNINIMWDIIIALFLIVLDIFKVVFYMVIAYLMIFLFIGLIPQMMIFVRDKMFESILKRRR